MSLTGTDGSQDTVKNYDFFIRKYTLFYASATKTSNREIVSAYLLLNARKFIFLVLFYTVVKIFFGFTNRKNNTVAVKIKKLGIGPRFFEKFGILFNPKNT